MNTAAAAPERCPRCSGAFTCGAAGATPCACTAVVLSDSLQAALRARFQGCLCLNCLRELAAQDATQPGSTA